MNKNARLIAAEYLNSHVETIGYGDILCTVSNLEYDDNEPNPLAKPTDEELQDAYGILCTATEVLALGAELSDETEPHTGEPSNEERAKRAEIALTAYQTFAGMRGDGKETDEQGEIADLLTDLLHFANRKGVGLRRLLSQALGNFDDERDSDAHTSLFAVQQEIVAMGWDSL